MAELVEAHPAYRLVGGGPQALGWRPADAPPSRYEQKALKAGRAPVFFELVRVARGKR
jgi:tRNA (guanine-N7-)-methyltransferase